MDDLELAKELRKLAGQQENFYHIHILNTAAKRLEETKAKGNENNDGDQIK